MVLLPSLSSKFILLAAQQVNKSRDKVLEQGIVTLFRKPADREDGILVSQRTILPGLEFQKERHVAGCCKFLGALQIPEGM